MPASPASPSPLLVLVTGKPGSGKSALARRLAETDALGLPLLSRDALKVGLVETYGVETDAVRATVVPLSYALFYSPTVRRAFTLLSDVAARWDRPDLIERAKEGNYHESGGR